MKLVSEELTYRVAVQRGRQRLYVDDFVTDLNWEETRGQLAQRCSFTALNERAGDRRVAQLLTNGSDVRVFGGDPRAPGALEEVFRGTIFRNHSAWGSERTHEVTAYDSLFFWLMSEDDHYFRDGLTGKQMLTALARKWEIPIGRIDGPNVKLGKKAFRGLTIAAMGERILSDSRRHGGGRWTIRTDAGKLSVIRRARNRRAWRFEQDSMLSADIDRSIENLVTVVKIVGREKTGTKVLATATSELARDIGNLQRVVNRADFRSPAAAKKAALQLLRSEGREEETRTVVAPDVPGLRRGDRVHIKGATMNGFYIAESVFHDAKNRTMTFEAHDPDPDEIDIRFRETGLDDWVPPEDQSRGGSVSTGGESSQGFAWPARGTISSGFGDSRDGGTRSHAGIDLAIPTGTPVGASKEGRVTFAGAASGYGLAVYIAHSGGWETRYAHLSRLGCSPGQSVKQGAVIGHSGNTGTSTGAHLHFETRQGGVAIDPLRVLP